MDCVPFPKFYTIKAVKPKDGVMREIHEDVLGRRCYILFLQIGHRGILKYEPEYDPGCYHSLHTSTVKKVTHGDNGVEVETRNTVYVLEDENEICDKERVAK